VKIRTSARLAVVATAIFVSSIAASSQVTEQGFTVFESSIARLQSAQASGETTSRQLVEQYLERIAAFDRAGPALNTIVTLNPDARADAERLDRERREGKLRGPLHGIPILVKDNYATLGMPTSAGTLALATFQTSNDATVVRRLREAGAIILGKTSLHELAAGTTTISSLTGATKNPYDLARSPGGSSGGSAAAVAANFAAAATGSDTCGSIRMPAAYQNLYGLRSTAGLVSSEGIVPLSSSQDVAGPITRSVTDLAMLMDVMVGADDAHKPASYLDSLNPEGLRGARIGVLRNLFSEAPEDAQGNALSSGAFDLMRARGAEVVDVNIEGLDDAMKDTSTILHEFKYEFAEFLRGQPNPPVHSLGDIIDRGLAHETVNGRLRDRNAPVARDEAAYQKTLSRRRALHDLVIQVMKEHKLDALAYPVSLQPPPRIGENAAGGGGSCQLSASTGLPVMAIPMGFTDADLPIGMELMGADFAERKLIELAYDWEQAAQPRRPPFSTPKLQRGRAPAPVRFRERASEPRGASLVLNAVYTPTTGALSLESRVSGAPANEIIGVMLHHGAGNKPGPVFAKLQAAGENKGALDLVLSSRERRELAQGCLTARLYTRSSPLGSAEVRLQAIAARDPRLPEESWPSHSECNP
jgi:Asp-tRNA(Asn)/Glu-tRNA(Gln) amidotransferase A subunit family amidase